MPPRLTTVLILYIYLDPPFLYMRLLSFRSLWCMIFLFSATLLFRCSIIEQEAKCENVFSLIRSITTLKAYTYLIVMKGGLVAYYFPYERICILCVDAFGFLFFLCVIAFSVLIKIKLFWYVSCISREQNIFVSRAILIEKPNNLNYKEHLKISFYATKTQNGEKKTRI